MKVRLILLIFIVSCTFLFGQDDTKAPKYSNEFLSIGIGSRPLAMGNSVVASMNDVTSGYWNPSCLTKVSNDLQLGAMHAEYFAGIGKFDYLGAARHIGDSAAIGISLIRFGVDDIPNTLDLIDSEGNIHYDRIKSFSVSDFAFIFSYAMNSKIPGLKYGANAKIIRRVVGEFAGSWGFGLDASAQYDYKNWKFGAIARDVTSTFNAWTFHPETFQDAFLITGNDIQEKSLEITMPKLILGAARDFRLSDKFNLLVEADLDLTFDGKRNVVIKGDPVSIDPHMGFEVNYREIVYFRGGVMNLQPVPNLDGENEFTFQPNIGIGLHLFNRLRIDYALTDLGDQSIALYSHVFSLSYAIDRQQ
ncbi:MAG: hypothetical protein ABIJ16_02580 [Bacteroidota bacterium]